MPPNKETKQLYDFFPTSHAFLVGVNKYIHLSPLYTPANDVEALSKALKLPIHNYTTHNNKYKLLNPTRQQFIDSLNQLKKDVRSDDRVLFYFAGHGLAKDDDEKPRGFIMPKDAKLSDENSAISMDFLHKQFEQMKCKHFLLILDCCFAGSFRWATKQTRPAGTRLKKVFKERYYRFAESPAWQLFTSAAYNQEAIDQIYSQFGNRGRKINYRDHSPFAYHLIEALTGEKADISPKRGDGLVTASELYIYIRDQLEPNLLQVEHHQTPGLFPLPKHKSGEYLFLTKRKINLPNYEPTFNPYQGLQAHGFTYEEGKEIPFYGRKRIVEALIEKMKESHFIVVSGASGTGKSSVVKAGLLPLLVEKGFFYKIIRPGIHPMAELDQMFPNASIQDIINRISRSGQSAVLVVDQMEEVISLCQSEDERLSFIRFLLNILQKRLKNLYVILTIRSDFEPQLDDLHWAKQSQKNDVLWAKLWDKGRYEIPPFEEYELREIIELPALQYLIDFEPPELVNTLLSEIKNAPGAFPLLSVTLKELFRLYLKDRAEIAETPRAITQTHYDKLGGIKGTLKKVANNLYDSMGEIQQKDMRELMLRMISTSGGEITRRKVYREELQFGEQKNARINELLEKLTEEGLIISASDSRDNPYYEPVHDALIRSWRRIYRWRDDFGLDNINLQRQLWQAAQEYNDKDKSKNFLWDANPKLQQSFLVIIDHKSLLLNTDNIELLSASSLLWNNDVEDENKTKVVDLIDWWEVENNLTIPSDLKFNENNNIKLDDLLAFMLDSSRHWMNKLEAEFVMESWKRRNKRIEELKKERDDAIKAKQQAEEERDRANATALAAKANLKKATDPTVAFNMAYKAYKMIKTPETVAAFHETSSGENVFYYQQYYQNASSVNAVAFSPDGKYIVTISMEDGYDIIKVWDILTGEAIHSVKGSHITDSAIFSQDDKYLIIKSINPMSKLSKNPSLDPGFSHLPVASIDQIAKFWRNPMHSWNPSICKLSDTELEKGEIGTKRIVIDLGA